jgi:hypothetical protein
MKYYFVAGAFFYVTVRRSVGDKNMRWRVVSAGGAF